MNANFLNHKTVRFNGNSFRITAAELWGKTLLSVECFFGPLKGTTILNLNTDRTKVGRALKQAIKLGLVS